MLLSRRVVHARSAVGDGQTTKPLRRYFSAFSIAASSSSDSFRFFSASSELSSWSTVRAPISAEVTRGSRSTQASASWARLWPRFSAMAFELLQLLDQRPA